MFEFNEFKLLKHVMNGPQKSMALQARYPSKV